MQVADEPERRVGIERGDPDRAILGVRPA